MALEVSWILHSSDNLKWEMLRLQDLIQLRQMSVFSSDADFQSGILSQEQPASAQGLADCCLQTCIMVWLCLFRWSVLLSCSKEDTVSTLEDRFCPSGLSQTEHLKGVRDWTQNTSGLLQEGEAVNYHWKWPDLVVPCSQRRKYETLIPSESSVLLYSK